MSRGRRFALGALALGVLLLSQCTYIFPNSYHFRMVVEVATPQGIKRGTSVYRVSAGRKLKLTSEESSVRSGFRGQALIVELPDGPIFVLVEKPNAGGGIGGLATDALLGPRASRDYVDNVGKLDGWFGVKRAELPR